MMSLNSGAPLPAANPAATIPISRVAPPAALSTAPSALALLKCLRRCWRRATFVGLVAAGIAAAVAWNMIPPATHVARTLAYIPTNDLIFPTVENKRNQADYQRTQALWAKSRQVLNVALKQKGINELQTIQTQANPLEWLEKEVQVDFPLPDVIRIAITGDNPDDLARIVVGLRDAYRSEVFEKVPKERSNRLEKLGEQKRLYEKLLDPLLKTQDVLVKGGGAKDLSMRSIRQTFVNMQLSWYQKDLISTERDLERSTIEIELKKLAEKRLDTVVVPETELQAMLEKDPLVVKNREHIKGLKEYIADYASKSVKGEADPKLQTPHKELAEAERALEKTKKDLEPRIADAWRAAQRAAAADAIRQLGVKIEMLTKNATSLRQQVEGFQQAIEAMNKNNDQIDTDRPGITRYEWLVKQIGDEEAKLKVEIDANPVRFEVMEEATVLGAANDKRRLMGTVGVFGATFALLLLAFAFHEFRGRRIESVEEVVHGLGMNLVGTIPVSATRSSKSRATPAGEVPEHSTFAEAIDATRVMLLRAARSESLRVVMVTSADSGEGKTSLSTHLAASLAQTNLRTLLIDGDLRNPIVHQIFGLDLAPGFCELLRGEATPESVIRTTSVDGLSMITAGRWSRGASQALARDGVAAQILHKIRENFDFVIIDSSPVLPVVDPLLIGQLADGTILSLLRDVSRMPNVYAAHQRLIAGGVRVLGAVVSGVRGEVYGSTYAYRQRVVG